MYSFAVCTTFYTGSSRCDGNACHYTKGLLPVSIVEAETYMTFW